MDEFIDVVKGLIRGEERQYGDVPNPIQFPWAEGYELPVWVAAYGPKALDSAGRMRTDSSFKLQNHLFVNGFLARL